MENKIDLSAAEIMLAQAIGKARVMRQTISGRNTTWQVDLDGAYRIQRAHYPDAQCIGYKLGLISQAKQQQMGLEQPIYGRIARSMIYRQEVKLNNFIQPRLEPELAIVLRHSIPSGATPGMAMRAIGGIFLGVDILDSVWTDYRFSATEVVADNASGGGFLLGERLLEQIPDGDLSLYLNGELRTSGPIAALGNIEQQLCWLAQTVGELKAGQIVFLGSPAQAIPAVAGVVEVVCGSSILQVQLTGVV